MIRILIAPTGASFDSSGSSLRCELLHKLDAFLAHVVQEGVRVSARRILAKPVILFYELELSAGQRMPQTWP